MTRQTLRISVAIMTTVLALAILWQFRVVVIYVLLSVTLAASLRPLLTHLADRKLWERILWILIYIVSFLLIVYSLYMVGKVAITEIQQLADAVSKQDQWTLPGWLQGSMLNQVLFERLLSPGKLFEIATYGQAGAILPAILGFTQSVANVAKGMFIIFALSIYWVLNKTNFERLWLSLLPSGQRKPARDIWQTIEPILGRYIRNQVFVNILAGILLGLGYWAIGSPYPMLLALVGAFASAVPFVGVAIAVIITLFLGLVTGMQNSQIIVLYTLAIMVILGVWVKPRLFTHKWDNPILTMVLLVALSDAFGLLGIIVAPAISIVIQIIWSMLVTPRGATMQAAPIPDFQQLQKQVWVAIRAMDEPPPPQITSTMERLDKLIEKAAPILKEIEKEIPANKTLPGTPASSQL